MTKNSKRGKLRYFYADVWFSDLWEKFLPTGSDKAREWKNSAVFPTHTEMSSMSLPSCLDNTLTSVHMQQWWSSPNMRTKTAATWCVRMLQWSYTAPHFVSWVMEATAKTWWVTILRIQLVWSVPAAVSSWFHNIDFWRYKNEDTCPGTFRLYWGFLTERLVGQNHLDRMSLRPISHADHRKYQQDKLG